MKKGFVLGLALVFGFALVMAITLKMDIKGKKAHAKTEEGYVTMTIKMEVDTGRIAIVDEKGVPIELEELPLEELEKAYESSNGVKHVSTLLHFHMSPGCYVMTLNGRPFVYPRGCRR
jgi:hypothetical protein